MPYWLDYMPHPLLERSFCIGYFIHPPGRTLPPPHAMLLERSVAHTRSYDSVVGKLYSVHTAKSCKRVLE